MSEIKSPAPRRCIAVSAWIVAFSAIALSSWLLQPTRAIAQSTDPANSGATTAESSSQTFVAVHGRLSVKGTKIVDKNGNPTTLHGMSLYC